MGPEIFETRFYRVQRNLLPLIGLWPYPKSEILQLIHQVLCVITVNTVVLSQGIRLLEIWGNLDMMIECLTPMGVQVGSTIKFLNTIIHRKTMLKLMQNIDTDWSELRNENETKVFVKYTEEGYRVAMLYAGFLYSCTFIYLLIPLLPRFMDVIIPINESRSTGIYLYQTQYYVDPEEYYILICIHTYMGTLITMTGVIATDTMFVCYVMHVRAVLAVVSYRLRNLTPNESEDSMNIKIMTKDEDYKSFQEIAFCIEQHHQALESIEMIESSYSLSYLLVIGIGMVLMSMSMVQLVIKLGQVGEMIRLVQFNLAQCNHLFFNSWPCQMLIDESISFRASVYSSQWYLLSDKNKHLLRFMMVRTLEPHKITAGGLFIMSVETFGLIMKSSFSYFTVFASIR